MLIDTELMISRRQLEIIGQFESNGHYLAIDQARERVGVLKILNKGNTSVYDFLMNHPHRNLCTIFDYWAEDDMIFVFEEYLSGRTLEDVYMKEGLSEEKAVDVLCQICDGLSVLHTSNPVIVHKDLKLANVMIDTSGCVKIIDFDISRVHRVAADRDTTPYGTVPYASPEHFGFGQTNEKSDQYAIGQMMRKMGLEYGRFAKIIQKTTEILPEKRYKNVMELKQDLMGKNEGFFPIPGFRTEILWKKIVAVLGYLLILFAAFSVECKDPKGVYEIWVNRLTVLAALLTEVDLFTKWTPLFRQIPLLNDSRAVVRGLAHIILGIIIFFIWVFLEVLVLHLWGYCLKI